ncbi:hypothetical protein D3C81_1058080 [compost metagenome]
MLPTSYSKVLLGKYFGTVVSILYVVFFMNKVSRDLLDGGLLIISSTLKETPRTAIIFLAIVILLGLMIGLVNYCHEQTPSDTGRWSHAGSSFCIETKLSVSFCGSDLL